MYLRLLGVVDEGPGSSAKTGGDCQPSHEPIQLDPRAAACSDAPAAASASSTSCCTSIRAVGGLRRSIENGHLRHASTGQCVLARQLDRGDGKSRAARRAGRGSGVPRRRGRAPPRAPTLTRPESSFLAAADRGSAAPLRSPLLPQEDAPSGRSGAPRRDCRHVVLLPVLRRWLRSLFGVKISEQCQVDGVAGSVTESEVGGGGRSRWPRRLGPDRPSSGRRRRGRCAEPKQATARLAMTGRSANRERGACSPRRGIGVAQRGVRGLTDTEHCDQPAARRPEGPQTGRLAGTPGRAVRAVACCGGDGGNCPANASIGSATVGE